MRKILLVIDMQNICVGRKHPGFFKYDTENLIKAVNRRIVAFDKDDVYYTCKVMKYNLLTKLMPFKAFPGTYEAALAEDVTKVSDKVFIRYGGDAFSSSDLCESISETGVDEVEIVGVDGGGCVALTALGALKKGIKPVVNDAAVGTMFTKKAEKYKAEIIKRGGVYRAL